MGFSFYTRISHAHYDLRPGPRETDFLGWQQLANDDRQRSVGFRIVPITIYCTVNRHTRHLTGVSAGPVRPRPVSGGSRPTWAPVRASYFFSVPTRYWPSVAGGRCRFFYTGRYANRTQDPSGTASYSRVPTARLDLSTGLDGTSSDSWFMGATCFWYIELWDGFGGSSRVELRTADDVFFVSAWNRSGPNDQSLLRLTAIRSVCGHWRAIVLWWPVGGLLLFTRTPRETDRGESIPCVGTWVLPVNLSWLKKKKRILNV